MEETRKLKQTIKGKCLLWYKLTDLKTRNASFMKHWKKEYRALFDHIKDNKNNVFIDEMITLFEGVLNPAELKKKIKLYIIEKFKQTDNDIELYKLQKIGELVNYQTKFCPGGFRTDLGISAHMDQLFNRGALEKIYKDRREKIIFSIEALKLNKKTYPGYHLTDTDLNDISSVCARGVKSFENLEMRGNVYLLATIGNTIYFASHYSSIINRETQSDIFCLGLSKLIDSFGRAAKKRGAVFGGFAGDINLYVLKLSRDRRTARLRAGVQEALNKHNLVLIAPKNLINKGEIRSDIHDQWHKVGKQYVNSKTKGNNYMLDSMIILEKYQENRTADYIKLARKSNTYIFFPDNSKETNFTSKNGFGEPEEKMPYILFNKDRTMNCITDHFFVEGLTLCVYNGADAHGIGNPVKSLVPTMNFKYPGVKKETEYLEKLNIIVTNLLNYVIDKMGTKKVSGKTFRQYVSGINKK